MIKDFLLSQDVKYNAHYSSELDGYIVSVEKIYIPFNADLEKSFCNGIHSQLVKHQLHRYFSFQLDEYGSGYRNGDKAFKKQKDDGINIEEILLSVFSDEQELSDEFCCPIAVTDEPMNCPAYIRQNPKRSYELDLLVGCLDKEGKGIDPFTRAPFTCADICLNNRLRNDIVKYREQFLGSDEKDEAISNENSEAARKPFSELHTLFTKAKLDEEYLDHTLNRLAMAGKALRRFASQGMLDEIKRLFKYFSPNLIIDQRDNNPQKRKTALHLALEFGHDNVATFLKDQGADVNIRNAEGITPAQLAPYHHMQP